MSIFVPDSTRSPQTAEEQFDRFIRRLALWSVICIVSAVPSFLWASSEYNRLAMACGVALFISLYTAFSCTDAFEAFHDRPHVRRTLYVGYLTRLAVSILFPLGAAIDLLPGLMSTQIAERISGAGKSFLTTLIATIAQGTLLNILIAVFMCIVYAILRATVPVKLQNPIRGFEVIQTSPQQEVR